ncbi:MAG: radical SAM protein [Lachnospiraceae bacterium]|nr:radical SAM protein [Lachnospiraceae bacterium]
MFDGPVYIDLVKKGVLVDATMELTSGCNLRCKHCYIDARQRRISLEDAKNIIDTLYNEGTINLTLTGGEIFTHPDFEEIYRYAKQKGFIIELKTNALLIDEAIVKLLASLPPEEVNITVYGLSDDEYGTFTGDYKGFSKLQNALSLLENNRINFSLYVVSNKTNYSRIANGDYKRFFNQYGLEFAFDNDVLGGRDGNYDQLQYRLSPEEVINIEKSSSACMEIMRARYAGVGKEEFQCIGGINKIYIDPDSKIHCCLFDEEDSVVFSKDNWTYIRSELKKRNEFINNLYQKSKCVHCERELLCRQCPLKWKRVIDKEERCLLAQKRRELIEESTVEYSNVMPVPNNYKMISLNIEFPHMALREDEIDNSQEYESQLSDYDVIYKVNGTVVHGHKGKYFYYLPAVDEESSHALGIPKGHALKILKKIDNVSDTIQAFEQYKLVSKILENKSLVAKTYSYVAIKMKETSNAFVVDSIIIYPKDSMVIV